MTYSPSILRPSPKKIRAYAVLTKRGFKMSGSLTKEFTLKAASAILRPGQQLVPVYEEYNSTEWMSYVASKRWIQQHRRIE